MVTTCPNRHQAVLIRRRVIVELRGELLTKRSSVPIEKVVNPLGTVITISMPFDDNGSCHQTMHGGVDSPQHLKRTYQKVLATEENVLEGGVRWPTDVKSSGVAATGEKMNVKPERDSILSGDNGELIRVNVNNSGGKLDFGHEETGLEFEIQTLDSNSALTTVGLEQMSQEEKSSSEGNIDRCPDSLKCDIGENGNTYTGSSRDPFENICLESKKVVFDNDDDRLLNVKLKSKKKRFEAFDAKHMYAECEHVEIQDPNLCTYPKLEGNITKSFKNTTKTKKIETKTNQTASKEVNKLTEKKAIDNETTQSMFMSTASPVESWSSTSEPWTKPVETYHELESIKRHIQPSESVKKCKIESIEEEHKKPISQPFKEIENFAKSKSKSGKKTWSCVVSNNPVAEPLSMDRSRSLLEESCDVTKESFTLEKLDYKTTKNLKKVPFSKDSSNKLEIEAILESGKFCSSEEKVEVIAKRSWSNIVSSNVRKDSHCLIDVEAPESVPTPSQDTCSDQVNFTDMQPLVNVPLDAFENAGAATFNLEPETIVIATEEEEENNAIGGVDAFNSSSQSLAKKSKKSKKKKR
ncbi:unnamed protein product [Timema podura]|uniref:Uncharacterized protein n=1 Tax=Timema podura TaxID=61482 RepID=A0ABN7NKQ8_TIMPD|nr:unnamed protein product [Timema podura]